MAYDKIVDSAALDADLTLIADAIREKTETTMQFTFPDGMVNAISNLSASEDLDDVLTEQAELIDDIYTELIESGAKMKQTKTAAPALDAVEVLPDEGYLLKKVTIEPITAELLNALDSDFVASNINEGIEMFGVTGTLMGRKPEQIVMVTPSLDDQVITPKSGHAISEVVVDAVDAELLSNLDADFKAENIAEGVNMFGITGALKGGGLMLDIIIQESPPSGEVINNQIIVVTSATPTNIFASVIEPENPIEGDIWIQIGRSSNSISKIINGIIVDITIAWAFRYDDAEWVEELAYFGRNDSWVIFSTGS